jgi:uncharacterized protein (DUF302 family)
VAGIEVVVARPIGAAEELVRQALAEQGFGVLTEIDVAATLRAKLGVIRAPLAILGACNPSLAHRALEIDPSVALLLPCNVVLEERQPGRTWVSIVDPRQLLPGEDLAEVANEGAQRLAAVAAAVGGDGRSA